MNNIEPSKYILDMVKVKFGSTILWGNIEYPIATLCSELPVIRDEETKKKTINLLNGMIEVLKNNEVEDADTKFLQEEIDMYQQTKQISLYEPGEFTIDEDTIQRFIKSSLTKEGVISTDMPFNWNQVKYLADRIFDKTQLVKFFITPEVTMQGQIVAQIYDTPQEIPIVTVCKDKKEDKEGAAPTKQIFLFGETINKQKWAVVKEVNKKFYVYKFISEDNLDYIMLSDEILSVGEFVVKGLVTKVTDNKKVTDSLKVTTKTPYLFTFQVKSRVLKFGTVMEFEKRLKLLNVTRDSMFNFPFTIRENNKNLLHRHPEWFKWLIWSWLTHSKGGQKGFNKYPFHILMIGPQATGKSALMKILRDRSKEKYKVQSGSSSTIKRLVPSFKYLPAKVGYLAESNRFAFLDELFRFVLRSNNRDDGTNEEVAIMNDLLEHQEREAGSGVSSVHVNMTARCFAGSNPVREVHCLQDLLKKFDNSFLSRWLIYWQDEAHIKLIQSGPELKEHPYHISDNDWVSLLDYLQSFDAKVNIKKVDEIMDSVRPVLSKELVNFYNSRHIHHILCILDGIVKTRCLCDMDMKFEAIEEDYVVLDTVWKKIIRSWIKIEDLRNLDPKEKLKYLPEDALWLYEALIKLKRPLSRFDIESVGVPELGKSECYTLYQVLTNQGILILNDDGLTVPFWWEDKDGQ